MSDSMDTAVHMQAVALLYGVRALRVQSPEDRETPRGKALGDLVERGAELLAILLDPRGNEASGNEPEPDDGPTRCAEHGCDHPEDMRQLLQGMGGADAQELCLKCGCTVGPWQGSPTQARALDLVDQMQAAIDRIPTKGA